MSHWKRYAKKKADYNETVFTLVFTLFNFIQNTYSLPSRICLEDLQILRLVSNEKDTGRWDPVIVMLYGDEEILYSSHEKGFQ